MLSDKIKLKKRANFIKICFDNPKKGADILRNLAIGLENCRNSKDVNFALQEILFKSESTIWNDYAKD